MPRKGKRKAKRLKSRQDHWKQMVENPSAFGGDGFIKRGVAGYKKPGSNSK